MSKEEFEKAIKSAEKQSSYFRAEQVALRAALEELERMRDGREVDETLYDELHQRYSQRLSETNEKAEQYRRITQSIKHLMRYDKELNLLSDSQQELIERLDKTRSQLEQERNKVEEMAERFGISIPPSSAGLEERRRISAPSKKESTEAESEIERLRQEILSELEKTRRQTNK
ncbi:hypothetical protein [[Eubacterium] cellulosolvens]